MTGVESLLHKEEEEEEDGGTQSPADTELSAGATSARRAPRPGDTEHLDPHHHQQLVRHRHRHRQHQHQHQTCVRTCDYGDVRRSSNVADMKFGQSICVLNVGGTRYAFTREVIRDFPLRRVSRLHACATEKEVLELCDDYDRDRNEFFFDRHAQAFVFIMLYVRSGKLRFVPGECELSFYAEMLYWGLESAHLDSCCQKRLDDRMSEMGLDVSEEDGRVLEDRVPSPGEPVQVAPLTGPAKWLEKLRKAFEEPNSSVGAQLLASVSVMFVIVSMVMLCASTLPDWDTAKRNTVEEHRLAQNRIQ